ncbi:DegQ family serine endoprotease [Paludibacterium paludis]|uniref:Probable periplasmic serine endoprotease DegP-like n=1 Tax=Paludibacterium paludis TaxID=1225769 RepID=A0A918NZ57_9NEIS|nr:DegQ family serine endoprotease [Paludibacterium paludis]GGY06263.1 peptidase [Paludibacterium paludis]
MNICLRTLLVATLTASALTGCDKVERFFKKEQPAPVAIPAQENGRVAMLLPDFTQLVDREGPAVVNIQANRVESGQPQPELPFSIPEDDPLYDFFRRLIPQQPQQPGPQDGPNEGVSFGSGFIISEDGYIMTNAHVVQGSPQIKVMMTDKRELKARLIGLDKRTDVAVLKVDAKSLPTVKIGDPTQLKVGEWVAAIGAPFGFENSVTAGIVSAKGRSLPDENYVPFIQTDVAINPGNSGGPLFNLKGEVVGINSQIYSRSGGFMGISFAIPIDLAIGVADQIKAKGKVSRGQLGVNVQEVSQPLAQSFGLGGAHGALVVRVEPGGPADKAGLQAGDIILKVNDKAIESSRELPVVIGTMKPGNKISLLVWRKGQEKNLDAVLSELSQETIQDMPADGPQGQSYQFGKLGLTVAELGAAQLQQLGLSGGLLVQKAQGVAARSGLQHGDIIIGVNQTKVATVKQFEKALADSRGNIALLVRRMDNTLFVPLRLN